MAPINISQTNLIKVFEPLNKVIYSIPDRLAGDVLKHGKEHLECYSSIRTVNLRN